MKFDALQTVLAIIDGELWVWGSNSNGISGLGWNDIYFNIIDNPTKVNNDFDNSGIKSVKCTKYRSYVLTNDGNIFACGLNNYHQIYDELINCSLTKFYRIEHLENIFMIDSNESFTLAISLINKVYIWGYVFGKHHKYPIGLDMEYNYAHKIICRNIYRDGDEGIIWTDTGLWKIVCFYPKPIKINFEELSSILDIACNSTHIIILTKDDKIYLMADNEDNFKLVNFEFPLIKPKIFAKNDVNDIVILHENVTLGKMEIIMINNFEIKVEPIDIDDRIIEVVQVTHGIFLLSNDKVYFKGKLTQGDNLRVYYEEHEFLSGKNLLDIPGKLFKNARSSCV